MTSQDYADVSKDVLALIAKHTDGDPSETAAWVVRAAGLTLVHTNPRRLHMAIAGLLEQTARPLS